MKLSALKFGCRNDHKLEEIGAFEFGAEASSRGALDLLIQASQARLTSSFALRFVRLRH